MTDEQKPEENGERTPNDGPHQTPPPVGPAGAATPPPLKGTPDGQSQQSQSFVSDILEKFKQLPTVVQILIPVGAMSAVLGFCCCGGCFLFFGNKDEGDGKPDASISAVELYRDYDSNEAAADDDYRDKRLEVSGVVDSVGKGLLDDVYIALKENDTQFTIGWVRCYVAKDNLDKAKELRKGQRVTIRGKCRGKLGPEIQLKGCVIVD